MLGRGSPTNWVLFLGAITPLCPLHISTHFHRTYLSACLGADCSTFSSNAETWNAVIQFCATGLTFSSDTLALGHPNLKIHSVVEFLTNMFCAAAEYKLLFERIYLPLPCKRYGPACVESRPWYGRSLLRGSCCNPQLDPSLRIITLPMPTKERGEMFCEGLHYHCCPKVWFCGQTSKTFVDIIFCTSKLCSSSKTRKKCARHRLVIKLYKVVGLAFDLHSKSEIGKFFTFINKLGTIQQTGFVFLSKACEARRSMLFWALPSGAWAAQMEPRQQVAAALQKARHFWKRRKAK